MLDVLIHIFHDIFGERRSKEAAMAESAMAKLRAPLTPGDDFAAMEMFADFFLELIVAGKIVIDDFAVVEDGFDFLRSGFGAESERSKRRAAGVTREFLTGKKACAESGAGVAGNRLDINVLEAAAKFESTDEKDVLEDPTREAKFVGCGFAAEIRGERDDDFFKKVLGAASDVCAKRRIERRTRLGETSCFVEAWREKAASVRA